MHKEHKNTNISADVFKDIYGRIENVFDNKIEPVVIGGRAVNILCRKNERPTDDIDLVVGVDPENFIGSIIENGFLFERNEKNKITKLIDRSSDVKIDIYYLRDVSGVDIDDIFGESREITIKNIPIRVASPSTLIIMKINAGREQDLRDVDALLNLYYKNKIDKFIAEEKSLIERTNIDADSLKIRYISLESLALMRHIKRR